MQTITPEEFAQQQLPNGTPLLDVRSGLEYRLLHASCAQNYPLDSLDPEQLIRSHAGSGSLYIICKSGARGQKACERFVSAGFDNVVNVAGGTDAWAAAGLPVERQAGMSLDRQVRLTVGLFVAVFALLGGLVHPAFSYLAAAFGGGLAFAAITNSCLMGMVLAKMPWNQTGQTCSR